MFPSASFDPFFIRRIHHLTKYPSIENYHSMDALTTEFNDNESVFVSEKVDGANVRIVLQFDGDGSLKDFFVGSRYNILYAAGDRNFIDELGIVQSIRSRFPLLFSDGIAPINLSIKQPALAVIFGELYGGKIGKAAKQYSADESVTDYRIFDVATIPLPDMSEPFDAQKVGDYRDENLQFLQQNTLEFIEVKGAGFAPTILTVTGSRLPKTPVETKGWLEVAIPKTQCNLGGGQGKAEGVIVRNANRSKIAKIRFENYRKIAP